MKNDLIREMAERLGRTGPDVEKALAAFAAAVADRLESEGEANLAGLGTLRKIGDSYSFEASDALSQAVDYRWMGSNAPVAAGSDGGGGLDPELVAPAADELSIRKASWAPIDLDPTAVEAPAGRATKPSAPQPPPSVPHPAAHRPAPAAHATAPDTQVPPTPAPPPVPSVPEPPPADSFAPPNTEDVSPLVDDLTYETLHQSSVPPSAPPPSRKPRQRAAAAPNRTPLLVGIVVVVLLAAAGLAWWQNQDSDFDPDDPDLVQNVEPEATAAEDSSAAVPAGAVDGGESPPAEDPGSTPAAPASIQPNSAGYTLIVGSSLSQAAAQRQADGFRSLGLPVGVLSYADGDGQTRHRIAVGEFASAAEADNARRSMSGLPDGTWVRRIRP
ncbi:MAG: SPOR domain-containing protein [Rhodothermales bacterium]|nr:SPOR domain-containing protein [Rhodothermales bacterium]MBO6779757.1 SPOR domain-containing protein [Rhodothermales bacterium]